MNDDISDITRSFISAINASHKKLFDRISSDTLKKTSIFLRNFKSIYTTNYDLILYWLLMFIKDEDNVAGSEFIFEDGFCFGEWGKYENTLNDQNIFYLHGALHIFKKAYTHKIKRKKDVNLTKLITDHIDKDGKLPTVVLEGNYISKEIKINNDGYLDFCFKKLKSSRGSLIILGASLDYETDRHIYNQIKNGGFEYIFYGLYDTEDSEQINYIKGLGYKNQKISFYDASTATDWEPIITSKP